MSLTNDDKKKLFELGRFTLNQAKEIPLEERIKVVNDNYIQAPKHCQELFYDNSKCMYEHGCSWKLYYGKEQYCLYQRKEEDK
jgi:hypothetical protein